MNSLYNRILVTVNFVFLLFGLTVSTDAFSQRAYTVYLDNRVKSDVGKIMFELFKIEINKKNVIYSKNKSGSLIKIQFGAFSPTDDITVYSVTYSIGSNDTLFRNTYGICLRTCVSTISELVNDMDELIEFIDKI
jgi:hypothetical protein